MIIVGYGTRWLLQPTRKIGIPILQCLVNLSSSSEYMATVSGLFCADGFADGYHFIDDFRL